MQVKKNTRENISFQSKKGKSNVYCCFSWNIYS